MVAVKVGRRGARPDFANARLGGYVGAGGVQVARCLGVAARAVGRALGRGGAAVAGAVAAVAAAVPASALAERSDRMLVDRVVAVVDGEVITLRELEALPAAESPSAAEGGRGAGPRRAALTRTLEREIDERVLNRQVAAMREHLGVGEKDIDRTVEEVRAQNRLSESQLISALAAQGMSMERYRAELRAQIERARAVQARMQGRPEPGAEAVRQRCLTAGVQRRDRVKVCAAHILVPLAPQADASARQAAEARARGLRGALAHRGAWPEVVAAAETDPRGDVQTGSLGCFARGEMVEAFEDAAFALAPGEVSEVVETPVGLHIIHLERREESPQAGCDTREELEPFRQALHQEDMQRQMVRWVEELRARASIEILL